MGDNGVKGILLPILFFAVATVAAAVAKEGGWVLRIVGFLVAAFFVLWGLGLIAEVVFGAEHSSLVD